MHAADNSLPARKRRWCLLALLFLLGGLLLRLWFLLRHPFLAGDSFLYQEIAQNWLHEHVYGLSTDTLPRPTLIRLPGYPAILAALDWLFGRFLHADPGTLRSFFPVLGLQLVTDLGTCCLLASMALRMAGPAAALAALGMACLCPFTANYVAVPLTETFTLFFLTLTFWLLQRWLLDGRMRWVGWIGVTLACSVLLRPDQGLLGAAVLPALLLHPGSSSLRQRLRPAALCVALAALPFVPWTARNLHTFHIFQPLAPKLANDPGEIPPIHFQRWFRTWAVDFSATQDAYWNYPESPVDIRLLPSRAFDTAAQRVRTAGLLSRAGYEGKLDPAVERGFEELARERIAAHPLRYYLVLPCARLVNMLLHPRVEMLPVPERWWQYRRHPRQSLFAWFYAALNLAYFLAAAAGTPYLLRRHRSLALCMLGYIALRCLLLLTLDNAEQRYTLEFFPILILFAAVGFFSQRCVAPDQAR